MKYKRPTELLMDNQTCWGFDAQFEGLSWWASPQIAFKDDGYSWGSGLRDKL